MLVHDDAAWVEVAKLDAYTLAPADVPIAEKVREQVRMALGPHSG